jgi:hypothetical protein
VLGPDQRFAVVGSPACFESPKPRTPADISRHRCIRSLRPHRQSHRHRSRQTAHACRKRARRPQLEGAECNRTLCCGNAVEHPIPAPGDRDPYGLYSVSRGIVRNGRPLRPKRTPFTCRPSSREDGSSGYSNRIQMSSGDAMTMERQTEVAGSERSPFISTN